MNYICLLLSVTEWSKINPKSYQGQYSIPALKKYINTAGKQRNQASYYSKHKNIHDEIVNRMIMRNLRQDQGRILWTTLTNIRCK